MEIGEKETVWVVGDIHGMYDPLKSLITELRNREALYKEKVKKLIFIGDYIDYGPSSKEVLDLLIDLEYETLFMAGNHEDMLLHYCKQSYFYEEYGNMWFNGNGGQETVLSFNPDAEVYDKVNRHPIETIYGGFSRSFVHGDYDFDKKYMDFFSNLVYAHTEVIEGDTLSMKLAFSHAGFDASRSLEEQLKLKTFDQFHDYVQKHKIYMKNFNLWSRKEPKEKYGDYIVVHGHTATGTLPDNYENLGQYEPESGMPYFKFLNPEIEARYQNYSHKYYFDADIDDLISINVDTGAVFGGHLTAVGFSYDTLWDKKVKVIQVATGGTHWGRKSDLKDYEIRVYPFARM